MTFEAIEKSARGGKPAQMFVFTRQSLVWRYARADRDITLDEKKYLAVAIKRSEIKQTMERNKDRVTITIPYARNPNAARKPVTQPLGDNWSTSIPSDPIYVMCLATHLNDPDQEVVVEWMGRVTAPKLTDTTIELTCEPSTSVDRARQQGARWQRTCWKTVYSTGARGCNLVPGPIAATGKLSNVTGNDITASQFGPKQRTFVGGTAEWMDGETPRSANITAASDTTLTLDDVTGLVSGVKVTAYTIALETYAMVTDVDKLMVKADEFVASDLSLAGGALFYQQPSGLLERVSIMQHNGDTITLLSVPPALDIGMEVTARPGCERTWSACEKRNNTDNHGGAYYKPVTNPHDGEKMA